MIKVILADDQRLMSEGIKLILEKDKDIKVVGYAESGDEVLKLCEQFQPDVVLMDINLPEIDGMSGLKLIKTRFGSARVIVLTGSKDAEKILTAMNDGANGYMLKDVHPEALIMSVKGAAFGLGIMQEEALFSFTAHVNACTALSLKQPRKLDVKLTEREISIIRYIIEGKENREIAKCIYLSEGTVKNTISGLLKKLDLRDRIQLVVFAFKNGLA